MRRRPAGIQLRAKNAKGERKLFWKERGREWERDAERKNPDNNVVLESLSKRVFEVVVIQLPAQDS